MTNEEILANAPEGATHTFENKGLQFYAFYEKGDGWAVIVEGEEVEDYLDPDDPPLYMRSLADIRRIVEFGEFIRRYRYRFKDEEQAKIDEVLNDG